MKLNSEHNNKHGFKTPDNYFESFEDKVFGQLNETGIENDISHGYKVPEGYFDTINETILNRAKSKPKTISFKPNPKLYYITGIAASLVLLFAIFINIESTDEISAEMVETYFQESDLDSYELAELLSEAELLEENFVITETEFNEDNLESYLLENSDIEQLLQ